MELEKVRELVDLMKANDLSELEVVDGQSRIVLKRGGERQGVSPQVVAVPQMVAPERAGPEAARPAAETAPTAAAPAEEEKCRQIVSPIVGTFYASPSPNADAFVEVGSKVKEDSVVCIIEAMKVMNEIKSELAGTIRKVLVENDAAVEYGQPLFLVELD
jgi:acetyl-CoA carboxylase biotin carboxyl carrier protein